MKIEESRILITGGAGALGKTYAFDLASRGAKVLAGDARTEALDRLRVEAQDHGLEIFVHQADVTNEVQVEDLLNGCREKLGGVDILINNAGVAEDGLLVKKTAEGVEKFSFERWQRVVDINVNGVFLCGREAAAVMVEQGTGGLILNMSSVSRHGNRLQSAYTATKAAVAAVTVAWAKELAQHRIRAVALAPGYLDTPLTRNIPPKFLEIIMSDQIPLGRLGEVAEAAHAVRFIIENDYFNGRVLDLDGGLRF
jgi:3-oxoacyl-[acyl-carrier protein] reductase